MLDLTVTPPQAEPQSPSLFPYNKWQAELPELAPQYRNNQPYPHIHLTDFLDVETAEAAALEFPDHAGDAWIQYKHFNENKLGMTKRELFPPHIGRLVDELNSPPFLSWLSELTGVPNLLADTTLEGGGMHQSVRGGFLNMHADFTMHHYHRHWRRRLNLILYLNPGWQAEWGGALELWDEHMTHCVARVDPLLNHAVIFSTDEKSFHGFPEKLTCPGGVARRSLALYYYTEEAVTRHAAKSTNYQPRPGDTKSKSAIIWLDKEAVDLYSRVKSRLGLSDDLASRVLGFLSRKK